MRAVRLVARSVLVGRKSQAISLCLGRNLRRNRLRFLIVKPKFQQILSATIHTWVVMCNINEMKKSAFHSKLDKLIKYQNCFTEKGLQGCSYDEVRNVNSKFKNRVPESVLEFLKKYGIQFSVCSKFNRLYSLLKGYDKVQEYLRTDLQECYKLEEYEIVQAAQAVDPLEIELDNVLIVDFYNGQTPSINFVKLDEEADPIIYEICEGEIMNCKISFSQYVYQTFAYNLEHFIQRIDYSKVFLDSFNFKNEYLLI